jgi:hypothetical protein
VNRKIFLASLPILALMVALSFSEVREQLFKAYDLIFYPNNFELAGDKFELSNGWIVEKKQVKRVTLREAGLIESPNSLVTVFSRKDVPTPPCGHYGKKIEIASRSVLHCSIKAGEGSKSYQIFDYPKKDLIIMFKDERMAISLLNSLAVVNP